MPDLRTWLSGLIGSSMTLEPGGRKEADAFAAVNNDFALALYERLREQPGNAFFSPFSVRTALGMALAGASGATAAQMGEALRLPLADEEQHAGLAEILERLHADGGGKFELEVANSLWGQDGAPLQPGFLETIARRYHGTMAPVDFRRHMDAAARINAWVEEKTRRKIRDLIPAGSLNALTRLVLVNAVYFKGQWVARFPVAETHDEPFYLDDGRVVMAPLMHQEAGVRFMQSEAYAAVDLDYRGCDLPMLVLLPNRKDGLADLERELTPRVLHDCVSRMELRQVEMFLPRFKITWGTVDLGRELAALGMPLAFDDARADFSGINGIGPATPDSLYLSAVFHKAFVEVNEAGTEAAAATAAMMETMAFLGPEPPKPKLPVFRADHPFLFAIRDRFSGAILFLGRVADPTREGRG